MAATRNENNRQFQFLKGRSSLNIDATVNLNTVLESSFHFTYDKKMINMIKTLWKYIPFFSIIKAYIKKRALWTRAMTSVVMTKREREHRAWSMNPCPSNFTRTLKHGVFIGLEGLHVFEGMEEKIKFCFLSWFITPCTFLDSLCC